MRNLAARARRLQAMRVHARKRDDQKKNKTLRKENELRARNLPSRVASAARTRQNVWTSRNYAYKRARVTFSCRRRVA